MYAKFFKRFFDIVLCSIALIVLSPIFLVTAIAIKLSSKGPVFYASKRAGTNGCPFSFYKFRSMHVTDNDKGMCVADAERLFVVGRLIRKLKIDELPQLINVIKGDMSIVGPRPMVAASVHKIYAGKYAEVLSVRPGLTSVASLYDYIVGDKYTDDALYRKEVLPIKLDMELLYVRRQSFKYDVVLIARTVIAIVLTALGKQDSVRIPEYREVATEKVEAVYVAE